MQGAGFWAPFAHSDGSYCLREGAHPLPKANHSQDLIANHCVCLWGLKMKKEKNQGNQKEIKNVAHDAGAPLTLHS